MRPEHRRIVREEKPLADTNKITDTVFLEKTLSTIELGSEVQGKVSELQEEKQRVMDWLREQLTRVKRGEQIELIEPNSKSFTIEYRDGSYIAKNSGQEFYVSLGEMLTDVSWGIDYDLDTESVPQDVAKQYVLSRAKARLSTLLNKQLVLIELDINEDGKQLNSFQAIYERQLEGRELIAQDKGFIAEQMTFNLMSKMILDHGLPISIEEADVYDDVVNKIDYVISRKDRDRGIRIGLEDSDEAESVGVQFTLMFRKASMLGKRETVLQVLRRGIYGERKNTKDIALVNVHPAYIKRAVNKWKKEKGPGGPDAHLEMAAKVDLVQKMLQGVFSDEEIDEIIKNTFDVDRHKIKIRKTY